MLLGARRNRYSLAARPHPGLGGRSLEGRCGGAVPGFEREGRPFPHPMILCGAEGWDRVGVRLTEEAPHPHLGPGVPARSVDVSI